MQFLLEMKVKWFPTFVPSSEPPGFHYVGGWLGGQAMELARVAATKASTSGSFMLIERYLEEIKTMRRPDTARSKATGIAELTKIPSAGRK